MHPPARNPERSKIPGFLKCLRLGGMAGLLLFACTQAADFTSRTGQNSVRWSFEDAALSNLYFPEQGLGVLLTVPVLPTDPSSEKWSHLEQENAQFTGKSPEHSLIPTTRWSAAVPLGSMVTARARSGSAMQWHYTESARATHILQSTADDKTLDVQGTQLSAEDFDFAYQTLEFAVIVRKPSWVAEFSATRHHVELQTQANLSGSYQGSVQNGSEIIPVNFRAQDGNFNGNWNAHYQGSAWTAGLRMGLSWIQVGLDFSTRLFMPGTSSGTWIYPGMVDPLTATPRLDGDSAWWTAEELARFRASELNIHRRTTRDSLIFSIPKQLRVTLRPSPHLKCEYTFRRGFFQLTNPGSNAKDPYDWSRYLNGQLTAGHQALLSSPWQYGYLYGGGFLLDGQSGWTGSAALLPQMSLLPQLGGGLTLGKTYRWLIGAELQPAIRFLLGASYAL